MKGPCSTCGKPVHLANAEKCNLCWEVESRLEEYLKSEGGRQYVWNLRSHGVFRLLVVIRPSYLTTLESQCALREQLAEFGKVNRRPDPDNPFVLIETDEAGALRFNEFYTTDRRVVTYGILRVLIVDANFHAPDELPQDGRGAGLAAVGEATS